MLCSEWSLVKFQGYTATVAPLLCRCWTCDHCAPIRRRWLISDAAAGSPDTLITLTVKPTRYNDPDAAARALVMAWRQIRRKAIKVFDLKSLPFLAVFERHKSGWPHLHVLARCRWIDRRWLSKNLKRRTGAWNADIRRVGSRRNAARYAAKYIGKDPRPYEGCKRYWRSRDYLPRQVDPDGDRERPRAPWQIFKDHWAWVARSLMSDGYSVECTVIDHARAPP